MRSGVAVVGVLVLFGAASAHAQAPDSGKKVFETFCARCHGADGKGGDTGPPIAPASVQPRRHGALDAHPHRPRQQGNASNAMSLATRRRLVAFLRELQRDAEQVPVIRLTAHLTDGLTLDGVVVNQGFADVQMRTETTACICFAGRASASAR